MIIKEKEATVEKTFEPFTIELTFQTRSDVHEWLRYCDTNNDAPTERKRVAAFRKAYQPVNIITQLLIKKGF